MSPLAVRSASPGPTAPAPKSGADLETVAQGFEAMLLRQMLSAAKAADFGGEKLFSGQAMDNFTDMQNAEFARIAAATGRLGLAKTIAHQLSGGSPPSGDSA